MYWSDARAKSGRQTMLTRNQKQKSDLVEDRFLSLHQPLKLQGLPAASVSSPA
jgi:hypothetical protein